MKQGEEGEINKIQHHDFFYSVTSINGIKYSVDITEIVCLTHADERHNLQPSP